jgi:hypothetical protein
MKIPRKPYVPKYANYDYFPVWQGNFIVDWIKVYYTIEKREKDGSNNN